MRNRTIIWGIAGAIGAFLLLGIAFRAGQASVMMNDFAGFEGRGDRGGQRFEGRDFDFDSEEEFREFMDENGREFGDREDREFGDRDDRNGDRDDRDGGRDNRGGGRDDRDGGRGNRGGGRGGFGPGRIIGAVVGFLARIAVLIGVVWVVLNWNKVQAWWDGRGSSTNNVVASDDVDDPPPSEKEIAVKGDVPTDDGDIPADNEVDESPADDEVDDPSADDEK